MKASTPHEAMFVWRLLSLFVGGRRSSTVLAEPRDRSSQDADAEATGRYPGRAQSRIAFPKDSLAGLCGRCSGLRLAGYGGPVSRSVRRIYMPGRALPHIKPRTLALWLSATLNPVPSIRPGNNHASHHQRICSHARPYRPNCGHYICCVLVRYVLDHLDGLSMQSRLKNVCAGAVGWISYALIPTIKQSPQPLQLKQWKYQFDLGKASGLSMALTSAVSFTYLITQRKPP